MRPQQPAYHKPPLPVTSQPPAAAQASSPMTSYVQRGSPSDFGPPMSQPPQAMPMMHGMSHVGAAGGGGQQPLYPTVPSAPVLPIPIPMNSDSPSSPSALSAPSAPSVSMMEYPPSPMQQVVPPPPLGSDSELSAFASAPETLIRVTPPPPPPSVGFRPHKLVRERLYIQRYQTAYPLSGLTPQRLPMGLRLVKFGDHIFVHRVTSDVGVGKKKTSVVDHHAIVVSLPGSAVQVVQFQPSVPFGGAGAGALDVGGISVVSGREFTEGCKRLYVVQYDVSDSADAVVSRAMTLVELGQAGAIRLSQDLQFLASYAKCGVPVKCTPWSQFLKIAARQAGARGGAAAGGGIGGAAAGAVVGSVVPVIGTVFGAIVGGTVGAVAGGGGGAAVQGKKKAVTRGRQQREFEEKKERAAQAENTLPLKDAIRSILTSM